MRYNTVMTLNGGRNMDGQRDAQVTVLAFTDMDAYDRHPPAGNDEGSHGSHAYSAVSRECA